MPNIRYFLVEDPAWIARLTPVFEARHQINAKRVAFLEEWGSNQVIIQNQTGNIFELTDPRNFGKECPAGWVKGIRGYVRPSETAKGKEGREILASFDYPSWEEERKYVAELIAAACPEDAPEVLKGTRWLYRTEGADYFGYIGFKDLPRIPNTFVCTVPNPNLKFESIPGTRELKHWEWCKLCEENNELAHV